MKTTKSKKHIECFVFCENNGKILFLLLKRTEQRGGFWQPVTGSVLAQETSEDTVIREVKEETGISKFKNLINTKYKFSFRKSGVKYIEEVWAMHVKKQKVHLCPEHTMYKWVTYENAKNVLYWYTNKLALEKVNWHISRIVNKKYDRVKS